MYPSEVRTRILNEHDELRVRLDALHAASETEMDAVVIRGAMHEFRDLLFAHIEREEALILPELKQVDGFGEERVRALREEHEAQRKELDALIAKVETLEGVALRSQVEGFVARLREDMSHEEQTHLSERLLKDDIVNVDVGT